MQDLWFLSHIACFIFEISPRILQFDVHFILCNVILASGRQKLFPYLEIFYDLFALSIFQTTSVMNQILFCVVFKTFYQWNINKHKLVITISTADQV